MNTISKVTILHLVLIVFLICGVIILSGGGRDNIVSASPVKGGNDFYPAAEMTTKAQELKAKLIERGGNYQEAKNFVNQNDFAIDYIYRSDSFVVSLKKSPYAETKKLAENWFMDQGFSGFDLCHLDISFSKAGSNFNDDLAPSDYLFSGCPIPTGTSEGN